MRWEQPEARNGRAAVLVLLVAIFVATALAIALVAGAASRSSEPTRPASPGSALRVTHDTSVARRH